MFVFQKCIQFLFGVSFLIGNCIAQTDAQKLGWRSDSVAPFLTHCYFENKSPDIYVIKNHASHLTQLTWWMKRGSSHENEETHGQTRLFCETLFKSNDAFPDQQYVEALLFEQGCHFSAQPGIEETAIFVNCRKEQLDTCTQLLKIFLENPTRNQEDIQLALEKVAFEEEVETSNSVVHLKLEIDQRLFPTTWRRWQPKGNYSTISTQQKNWSPIISNEIPFTLVVTGEIKPEKIRQSFSGMYRNFHDSLLNPENLVLEKPAGDLIFLQLNENQEFPLVMASWVISVGENPEDQMNMDNFLYALSKTLNETEGEFSSKWGDKLFAPEFQSTVQPFSNGIFRFSMAWPPFSGDLNSSLENFINLFFAEAKTMKRDEIWQDFMFEAKCADYTWWLTNPTNNFIRFRFAPQFSDPKTPNVFSESEFENAKNAFLNQSNCRVGVLCKSSVEKMEGFQNWLDQRFKKPIAVKSFYEGKSEIEFLQEKIYFKMNSFQPDSSSIPKLKMIADFLRQHPKEKIVVEGHTDTRGPEQYNFELSIQRATAVADFLHQQFGVEKIRMEMEGLGERFPEFSELTQDELAKNRRVIVRRKEMP